MKRMIYMIIVATVALNLIACQNSSQQDRENPVLAESEQKSTVMTETKTEQDLAIELYNAFLTGNVKATGWDINEMTIPTGEPDKRYATNYAFFDSNGDEIPELHVNAARYYYVFTIRDSEMVVWKDLSPYPHYYALNNGAFISRKFGAGPKHDVYNYIIMDYLGNEIFGLVFSKYDQNQNGIYDDSDEFLFDWINVTKEQWELLTERYIYIDEAGIEQVKNEIEWTVLFDGTN
ncbi:hypothetical protein LJC58_09450 [Lachnospiraceae bacterium OttesenSCG-928-D06]|nr:hypothetical protein [Lachnospiraceae bacterium OttesenSCG-928-D06]